MELVTKIRDFAWPSFDGLGEDITKLFLRLSLLLWVPLFAYYGYLSWALAQVTSSWMALAYAPHLAGIVFCVLFVSLLGFRFGGCVLEIVAVVKWKLFMWGLLMGGGSLVGFLIVTLFLWYCTQLARACFALENVRSFGRW
jgi:hypothetical protein